MGVAESHRDKQDWRKRLLSRTKEFALQIVRLYSALPKKPEALVIGKQLLRSGTAVGAHYREACRARSRAEFVSKIEGGLQELEETIYWLELLVEGELITGQAVQQTHAEAAELMAMLVASAKTAKQRLGSA